MAVDQVEAVSKEDVCKADVIAKLFHVADVCSGKVPVNVTEVVKSAREMSVETVNVSKLIFDPAGALRAYELIVRCLNAKDEPVNQEELLAEAKAALDVPPVGEGWSEQGYAIAEEDDE